MQRFNTNTIESKFIKGLLYNSPIPLYKTVTKGDYIIKDFYYIFRKNLIFCKSSGILGKDASYVTKQEYVFANHYIQYGERYMSMYGTYDSETHEKLGNYLRCYRDIYGIDCMPFYNCFSNNYIGTLTINQYDKVVDFPKKDLKVAKIPIRYDKTYTIAIDCNAPVKIGCALLDGNQLLNVSTIKGIDPSLSELLWKKEDSVLNFTSLSFKSPVTYKIENRGSNEDILKRYEDDLYLLIQLPLGNESSIVVLEGDYTNLTCKRHFNNEYIDYITKQDQNKLMLSQLSLLQFNDGIQHPFADRLIEYLLKNVIVENDDISSNIQRTTEQVSVFRWVEPVDIWEDSLRSIIYNLSMNNKYIQHLDLNGWVDKDTEKMLVRGRRL